MLQNRHEMASYFWAMVSGGRGSHALLSLGSPAFLGSSAGVGPPGRVGALGHLLRPVSVSEGQEGVATALAACKILREMAHLETEAKYEQLALGEPWAWCLAHLRAGGDLRPFWVSSTQGEVGPNVLMLMEGR